MDKQLQQEDTVSADRKERIIFDPSTGKSRKVSSVVSRQNFNNAKYGNRSPIQDVTGTEADVKKEEVTLTAKDLAEEIVKKSLSRISIDKNLGIKEVPFDGPYTKTPDVVVDKSGAKHTPYSRVRDLARKAMKQQMNKEEVELEEGYDKTSLHHKAARAIARSHGGKATFNSDGSAHVRFNDTVTGRSTVNPSGTLLHTGSEMANRAVKDHGAGKVEGNVVHFKEETLDEKAPEGFEGTVKAMKKHKDIDNPWALANWMKKKGYKSHVKEETEQLDEIRKDDAYTRDYKSSVSGMGKHDSAAYNADGGANDEGWGNENHSSNSMMNRPHTVHINGKPWKQFSNGHQAHAAVRTLQAKGRNAVAIAHFKEDFNQEGDTNMSKTYAQFIEQLLEYTPGPGGVTRVQGRSYGAQYHDPEGDDDADDKVKAPAAAPAVKRGRGRPAGSKSGANVKRLSSKGSNGYGYDSTGYKLHLPNSNK